jgi:hypothetical protein
MEARGAQPTANTNDERGQPVEARGAQPQPNEKKVDLC